MSDEPEDKRLSGLLTAFDLAYQRAMKAIESDSDLDRAFRRATVIGERVQALREQLTELRAQTAKRIYDSESLSLSVLANRVGVSRSRAAQLVREATKQEEEKSA
jgi:DNA-directed RNA polymerase specialized sigma subunit